MKRKNNNPGESGQTNHNKYAWGHKRSLVLMAIAALITSLVYAVTTLFTGQLIDFGMAKDMDNLLRVSLNIVIAASITFVLELISIYFTTNYVSNSMIQAKEYYITDVLNQEILNLQKDKVPRMYSNLTNDFDRYETKYIKNITVLVSMITQLIASMLLMASIHPVILIIPAFMFLFMWRTTKKTGAKIKTEEDKKTASLESYTGYINETIRGYEVIKQHQLEEVREEKFLEKAKAVQADNYQVDVEQTKADAISSTMMVGLMITLLLGGVLIARQMSISLGSIVVIFMALGNLTWPMQRLNTLLNEMRGIEDVMKSFAETFKVKEHSRTVTTGPYEEIIFDHNDLGYEDPPILRDVSLSLAKDEKILIVGPSGAGKSTILKTLRQTIEPLSGVVTLNGEDILSIVPTDYFAKFSTVDQIGFIFSGKLRDNITLYQEIDPEKVTAVLKQVGLETLDPELEVQNDGSNLSGGQRARVLLARALCLEAEVIVCDEIFASLDAEVARSIESDILALAQTVINVSHIYFSENLPNYDRIYIVENGQVQVAKTVREVEERMLEFERTATAE